MYNYKWTNSIEELKQWDSFLQKEPRGSNLQISHWLASYRKYGFDFNILIVKDNNEDIVAGMGVILAGISIFKVLIAPSGPVISKGHEILFEKIISLFIDKAKQLKALYCHTAVPIMKERNPILDKHCLDGIISVKLLSNGIIGNKFKNITTSKGFRPVLINYNEVISPYEGVFKNFNKNTKRNIKKAQQNKLVLKYSTTIAELQKAYKIIELNALTQHYAVRPWRDIDTMLINSVKDGLCLVPTCYFNGDIVGALIVFEVGQRLTYISGGISRERGDLKIGHFLHNEMIKYCINKGYSFYDISIGGPASVTRFKEGFHAYPAKYLPIRYWVLRKPLFSTYIIFSHLISRNKVLISKVLKLIK